MKRAFGYGIAVFALSAAPVLAQTSGAGGTTQGRTSGSTAGTQSGNARTAGQQGADRQFVMEAVRGGMAEVELGQLASQKAQSDQVKQFAQRMVQDHGKANDELKSLAQQKNITMPTQVDAKHKATQDRLSKLSGAQFDRAYMQAMLQDHRRDVNDFRRESQSGKDADLKAWAAKTLPTLEEHLRQAQSTSGAVGTSGSKSGATTGATGRPGDQPGHGSSGRTGGSSGTPGTGPGSTGSNNPR